MCNQKTSNLIKLLVLYKSKNKNRRYSKRRSSTRWIRTDLNRRPPTCEAGALPTELRTQITYLNIIAYLCSTGVRKIKKAAVSDDFRHNGFKIIQLEADFLANVDQTSIADPVFAG